MYFRFVDDVILSDNGPSTPESMTSRIFRPVRQVAAPGAKSAVSDCILLSLPVPLVYIASGATARAAACQHWKE